MELVHEKLRSYFKEIGMSQVEIAEKLGVSKTTVNNLLTGYSKFGKAQAEKWSELFGISKSFLLTGEGKGCVGHAVLQHDNLMDVTLLAFQHFTDIPEDSAAGIIYIFLIESAQLIQ